ncbi:hypothetical protein CONLIGDRAFT_649067 [Coniochaeta ligniaria NRRL 30616]|uniref:Uncharacterized protein n=1 Tax=Coniochaeta ligniaria NRRL 30616 TaxID=1408157 RepID=A0A1J7I9J8_9PEZI|nr:hypothetical protein CONLIGDRAFT_649067 [Coniochaeta ligniaria NRRL 30616]
MDIRTNLATQNHNLAAQNAAKPASLPRDQLSPRSSLADGNDDFEVSGHHEFPRRDGSYGETKLRALPIKPSNVGQLDPIYPDQPDLEMVSDGESLVFTNAMALEERLYTVSTNQDTESQVLSLHLIFFTGSACIWRNSTLTAQTRHQLWVRGQPVVLNALRQRCKPNPATSTVSRKATCTSSDLIDHYGNPASRA